MRRPAKTIAALPLTFSLAATANAEFKPLAPGQYQIGVPAIQVVCLKADGSWYGTTFNFGGRWTGNSPGLTKIEAAIYGNYSVQGHKGKYFANDTITVERPKGTAVVVIWYDWYDDFSFANLLPAQGIFFVQKNCDPPFTGQNTHAATQ